jgi:hypothetical protein
MSHHISTELSGIAAVFVPILNMLVLSVGVLLKSQEDLNDEYFSLFSHSYPNKVISN